MPPRIITLSILAAVIFATPLAGARHDAWVEVRSPNFIIVTNAGEKEGRKLAVQFEQIRDVFRASLAVANNHPSPIVTVVAAKDESTMRDLYPEYWEKGRSHPAGMFEHLMEIFYIGVQIDAPGDNPFHTVYHEYYHSLTMPYYPGLPLWLAEGLADFYGNTVIEGTNTTTGRPDPDLIYELKNSAFIPLGALLKVDQSSPYYTQEGKASIFYAEAWALTHYLMVGDREAHIGMLKAYLGALSNGASEDEAASKAFGDLNRLQQALQNYISSYSFSALQMKSPPKIDENQLTVKTLSDGEAETYRAALFLIRGRAPDAKTMLQNAIKSDPNFALAHEYLGMADFFTGQREDASAETSKAIELDPKAGMARYIRAELNVREGITSGDPQEVDDLRAAISAMPNFAASYALLAVVLASNNENLDEALQMAQKAVSMEPANANFQLSLAQVLARMGKYDDARLAGLRALEWSKEPEMKTMATSFLNNLKVMQQYAPNGLATAHLAAQTDGSSAGEGKWIGIVGTISNAKCSGPLEFDVVTGAGNVHIRIAPGTVYTISVPGTQVDSKNPCPAIEGKSARVGYLADKDSDDSGILQMLEVTPPEPPPLDQLRGHAPKDATIVMIEGTVTNVSCAGSEMYMSIAVRSTSITLHTKDFAQVVFTANTKRGMGDLAPCSDLKSLPVRVGFIPNQQKKSAGDIQAIIIEK